MKTRPKPALLTTHSIDELSHLLRGCVEAMRQRGAGAHAMALLREEAEELALALGSTPARAPGRPTLTVIDGAAA